MIEKEKSKMKWTKTGAPPGTEWYIDESLPFGVLGGDGNPAGWVVIRGDRLIGMTVDPRRVGRPRAVRDVPISSPADVESLKGHIEREASKIVSESRGVGSASVTAPPTPPTLSMSYTEGMAVARMVEAFKGDIANKIGNPDFVVLTQMAERITQYLKIVAGTSGPK
jgi:hypothetical protein